MTEKPYRTGEIITVAERNVRVVRTEQDPEYGLVIVVDQLMKGGCDRERRVFPDAPGTTVDRVVPAEGKPRPGQTWADRSGVEWFAVLDSPMSRSEVRLVAPDGRREEWLKLHADYRELGPLTLVRDVPMPADDLEED